MNKADSTSARHADLPGATGKRGTCAKLLNEPETTSLESTTTTLDLTNKTLDSTFNDTSGQLTPNTKTTPKLDNKSDLELKIRDHLSPMSCNSSDSMSDVSSDGDAASIVSRLSQIVVEEETKLQNKYASSECIYDQKDSSPICYNFTKIAQANNEINNESPEQVPQINIQISESNLESQLQANNKRKGSKDDRHSAKLAKNSNGTEIKAAPIGMRRNESSGFLPERGDLRRLESFRNHQKENFRNRSNTTNNMIRPKIERNNSNELVLNIKRTAWKLSDFDNTFEATKAEQENQILPTLKIDLLQPLSNDIKQEPQDDKSDSEKPTSTTRLFNSFRQKSSNCSTNKNQQTISNSNSSIANVDNKLDSNLDRIGTHEGVRRKRNSIVSENNPNQLSINNRRPSNAHSISSLASSIESYYSGFGRRINKAVLMRRGRRRTGRNGCNNDKDDEMNENCCRSCFSLETFGQYLPILDWLPKYKSSYLLNDLTGGVVIAIMNISTCISAAVVAETDLSVAFRASIINTFIYSILCSSRHSSFGSWSIMSQMLLVSVEKALNDEYILDELNLGVSLNERDYEKWHFEVIVMYTFSIGLIQLICGLLNLGSILSSFIPEALCSSLIAGTAVTMAFNQLANMMGTSNKLLIAAEKNATQPVIFNQRPVDITDVFAGLFTWVKQFILLIMHYDLINPTCAIISLVSLLSLYLNQFILQKQLESLLKKKILIPFEMVLVIVVIPITYYFELNTIYQVPTCGSIDGAFVVPNIPDIRLFRELWDQSLATALISYTMTYIMAKSYGNKLNYEVDYNQELIACGAGNLVGGLFDALPATASFVRTAGNVEAGGKTQMTGIINCVILVGVMQLFGSYAQYLPVCLMSTCLFFGFIRLMSRIGDSIKYWRICKVDFAIWIVSFLAILSMDIVNGFVYGFIFTILTMLYRAQNRRSYMLGTVDNSEVYVPLVKYPLAKEIDGIKIFQFCGPIHYVCADLFERLLRQKTKVNVKYVLKQISQDENGPKYIDHQQLNLPTHIILDFSMISYIDSAGIHIIKKIVEDYQQIQVTILIASLASHVASIVKSEPSLWNTYKDRFYVGLADAVHCAVRDNKRQQVTRSSMIAGSMQPPAMIKIVEAKSL